jgi:hypothetical protein
MVAARWILLAAMTLAVAACSSMGTRNVNPEELSDVHVADFRSSEMDRCRPSDVPLGHGDSRKFFLRAKVVDARTLHDHYNFAPCHVEGTLNYQSNSCECQIRAGATGQITCGKQEWLFACDDCDDLFAATVPR